MSNTNNLTKQISSTDSEKSTYKKIKDWVGKFMHDVLSLKHGLSGLSNMGFALITEFLAGHLYLKDLYIGLGAAALTIPYVIVKTLYELKEHGISMKENKTNGLKVIGMELLKKVGTLGIVCAMAIAVGYIDIPGLTYILPSLFGMGASYLADKLDNAYGVLSHLKGHAENRDAELGINNNELVNPNKLVDLIEAVLKNTGISLATNTENTEDFQTNINKNLKEYFKNIDPNNLDNIILNLQERINNTESDVEKYTISKMTEDLKGIQKERSNQNERTVTGAEIFTGTQPSTSGNQASNYISTDLDKTQNNSTTTKIKITTDKMPTPPAQLKGQKDNDSNDSEINLHSIPGKLVRQTSGSSDTITHKF